jgi:SAM-dependent methyltransferase
MEASEGLLRGAVLHEALHSTGIYAAMYKDSTVHYAPLLSSIRFANKAQQAKITSVLDVGCGTGYGVKALWSLKFTASGVDISPSAIATAKQRYVDPKEKSHPQCVLHNCFLNGNVARQIPFPTNSVDAILSAGLLEHVEAKDVDRAIGELTRVSRKYLFLQIASESNMPVMTQFRVPKRGNRTGNELVIRDYRARAPHPIEVNLRPQVYWISAFEKFGFTLERNVPLPAWSCCAFVLRRNSTSQSYYPRKLKLRASPGLHIG